MIQEAALQAAQQALSLQPAAAGAAGPSAEKALQVARRHVAGELNEDTCVISKALLGGILDTMDRTRRQLVSARAFFEGGVSHFNEEIKKFDEAMKYMRYAQKRAGMNVPPEPRSRSRTRARDHGKGSSSRGSAIVHYEGGIHRFSQKPRSPRRDDRRSRGRDGRDRR